MSDSATKAKVFLSYAARDRAAAQAVVDALEKAGCDVSSASALAPGEELSENLRKAMSSSDAFVLVTSPHSAQSPWTAYEVGAAMAWKKPIYVVATETHALPNYLLNLKVLSPSQLPALARSVKREAEPLSEVERDVLTALYAELGMPADKLVFDPDTSSRLAEEFGRRTRSSTGAGRLLRELLRLRKTGRLPRLKKTVREHGARRTA